MNQKSQLQKTFGIESDLYLLRLNPIGTKFSIKFPGPQHFLEQNDQCQLYDQ